MSRDRHGGLHIGDALNAGDRMRKNRDGNTAGVHAGDSVGAEIRETLTNASHPSLVVVHRAHERPQTPAGGDVTRTQDVEVLFDGDLLEHGTIRGLADGGQLVGHDSSRMDELPKFTRSLFFQTVTPTPFMENPAVRSGSIGTRLARRLGIAESKILWMPR